MKQRRLRRVHITASQLQRLNRLFRKVERQDAIIKGRTNERYVEQMLRELAEQGKIPVAEQNIMLTEPFSEADRAGVDIILSTDRGPIPIQVKSSWHAYKTFRETHPDDILCFKVSTDTNRRTLAWVMQTLIVKRYYRMQQRVMA